jgi:excisionase family DNA binding protein
VALFCAKRQRKGEAQMEKELLKVEEAADVLSISVRRMYELIAAREIRSVKLGRVRRVPVAALIEFVDRLNAESVPAGANGLPPEAQAPERPGRAKTVDAAAGDGPTAA